MLNFINSIPDSIGWALVGALAIICVIAYWKVGKIVYFAIKERIEDNKNCEICEG